MKRNTICLILVIVCLINPSCHRNRLKTNEKELTEEILLQEKKNKSDEKASSEKQFAGRTVDSNVAIHYKEDRSVDPAHPPLVIDIAGNLENVKEIKLSDVASEITYLRIQPPPDSSFSRDIRFIYHLTDNYIIASNQFGIIHYDHKGNYINTIVKNQFTGLKSTPDKIVFFSEFTFIGAYNINVTSIGDKVYYYYFNNIAGQEYLMEYDCSANQIGQIIKYNPENPVRIIGQGKNILDLNHGRTETAPRQLKAGGMGSTTSASSLGQLSQGINIKWIDGNTYSKRLWDNNMLAIFNRDGDTLATFVQYEKLVNYTKSLERGTDFGNYYNFSGRTYFRDAFNDTIFLVVPPNRLIPVLVLDLGSYKATRQQGVDPGFDLKGKIILGELIETDKYIFLTFTKDSYDCPNTRKNKTLKIYYALYSKLNHQLSVINSDPFDYSPEILKNDLDGGVPVWPSADMTGGKGEIMISLKGRDLKERVKSEYFKQSTASEGKKNELKKLAESVSDFEDILMLIK